MNANDLSVQLTALSDSLRTTNSLIGKLARLTFEPGSEPLDAKSGVRVELAQDIHDSLKQLEEELELLKQEAEDFTSEGNHKRRHPTKDSEEARLTAKVSRLGEELVHSRQQFRNAQISAKLASDQAKIREREAILEGYRKEADLLVSSEAANSSASAAEQLFGNRNRRTQQQKQLSKDEQLVNASRDVTAALRRTHDLLSTELSRSRFAQETFDESTAALEQLGEEYSNLDNILSNSRNLLGTLLRSQKSDTWYLETAFYILVATLIYLVFRRLLLGPFFRLPLFLWRIVVWVVWKPLFLFLSITGVITKEPISNSAVNSHSSSSSRPPLIVQPSAQGGAPSFQGSKLPEQGIPAGAGGAHAKVGKGPILSGELSEKIAKMAEESAQPEQQQQQQFEQAQQQNEQDQGQEQAQEKPVVRRGDGTILQERTDEQPNPKKKMFEADVEDAKHQQRRKRDEL